MKPINKSYLSEKELRSLVKILLEDKTLAQHWVKVNPVVDPLAVVTDPSNKNFKPSSKAELCASIKTLVDDVSSSEENIASLYDAIKDAMESQDKKERQDQMKKSNGKLESLRRAIRMLINEALPVSPPPPLPKRKILPALAPIDPELEDLINSGATRGDVVKFLKKKNPSLKGPEAAEQADGYLDQILGPKNAAAREKFLSAAEKGEKAITKIPTKFKDVPTSAEVEKFSSTIAQKAEDALEKEVDKLYTANFNNLNVKGVNFDLAAEAYHDAYIKAMELLPDGDPQSIVDSKEFDKNFKNYLMEKGISSPPTVKDVRSVVGYEGIKILGEKLQKASNLASIKLSAEKRQNVSDDATVMSLKETAEALKLSISMIKKIEAHALGKYILGIKSEIYELIPDDVMP